MKDRWLPVAVLAGTIFGVNVIARFIVRLAAGDDDGAQIWIGLVALGAVAAILAVSAVRWMRRFDLPRTFGDLALGLLAGCLLSTTIGPFASSGEAFGGGVSYFMTQLFSYVGVGALGAFLGGLGVVIAGQDHKSRSWQRYAESMQSRPGRVARR